MTRIGTEDSQPSLATAQVSSESSFASYSSMGFSVKTKVEGRIGFLANLFNELKINDPVFFRFPYEAVMTGKVVGQVEVQTGINVQLVIPDISMTGESLSTRAIAPDDLLADEMVIKLGATTGVTQGRITAVELDDVNVRVGSKDTLCSHLIEVSGDPYFSRPGDAGAPVIRWRDATAVGLVVASDSSQRTFVQPIAAILQQLNCELTVADLLHAKLKLLEVVRSASIPGYEPQSVEAKRLLDRLREEIEELLEQLPADKADEAERIKKNRQTIVKLSTGKELDRQLYSLSAKGLLEAAAWVKDITPQLSSTIAQLGKLFFPDF